MKADLFNDDLRRTAAFFKALGHPARLAILSYLAEKNVCMTGDISGELPLSRTTINQHLKELKDLNLIKGTIDGAKVNYCLNITELERYRSIGINLLDSICNSENINCKTEI